MTGTNDCNCGPGGCTEGDKMALRRWRGVFTFPPGREGEGKGIRIAFSRGEDEPILARRWLKPEKGEISGGKDADS